MFCVLPLAAFSLVAFGGIQPVALSPQHAEPIPADVAVDVLVSAYSTRPVADEVRIKVRVPGDIERTEFFVIRVQPGATPAEGPLRFFLDFGRLKVVGGEGAVTAINAATPGKYARSAVAGRLGIGALSGFIPPIAIPQLVLASGTAAAFGTPTPFTPGVKWTSATADDTVRPPVVTISGAGPSGTVVVTANADTGRLLGLRAVMPGRTGETVLEMTMRGVDPGDPAQWALRTEGRSLVPSVSDLRPSLAPRPMVVEDLTGTRADGSAWSLHQSLPTGGAKPLAMVLIREFGGEPEGAARLQEGLVGLAAIHGIIRGAPEAEPPVPGMEIAAAALIVVDPATFKPEQFGEMEQRWVATAQPGGLDDRPMWTSGGAAILDKAGAVLAVINPDRTLRAVIALDGRTDAALIAEELRAALPEPAKKETAAPEAPR